MEVSLKTVDALSTQQQSEFKNKSLLLGHNYQSLTEGKEELTFFTTPDLETFKKYICHATEEQKKERLKTFFNPSIASRSRLGQGMHDRGEAFIFAGGALCEEDSRGLANHLPLHIKAVSVLKKVIKANETWDVSVRGEVWGLDDMEELYVTLNIGLLVIEPGAKLVIRGNVFSMLCQKVICIPQYADSVSDYHIGILPTPFSMYFGHVAMNGSNALAAAQNCKDGHNGCQVMVERTFIGYRLREEINAADMNGTDGEDGSCGHDGARGKNGGMCKLAELTFREVEGMLTVFSQAGKGSNGSNGENGGNGGNGGNGSEGYNLIRGLLTGGNGGKGGNGGNGGSGGNGGNGGLSSNIYINVPCTDVHKITRRSFEAQPGNGGSGGMAGIGGKGGSGANTNGALVAGVNGTDGINGIDGKAGLNGKSRPAAYIFLNEQL
jgi:hypothetical protein